MFSYCNREINHNFQIILSLALSLPARRGMENAQKRVPQSSTWGASMSRLPLLPLFKPKKLLGLANHAHGVHHWLNIYVF